MTWGMCVHAVAWQKTFFFQYDKYQLVLAVIWPWVMTCSVHELKCLATVATNVSVLFCLSNATSQKLKEALHLATKLSSAFFLSACCGSNQRWIPCLARIRSKLPLPLPKSFCLLMLRKWIWEEFELLQKKCKHLGHSCQAPELSELYGSEREILNNYCYLTLKNALISIGMPYDVIFVTDWSG